MIYDKIPCGLNRFGQVDLDHSEEGRYRFDTLGRQRVAVGTSSPGKPLYAPFAVDMTAREDLWLLEVIFADWTRDLLLRVFNYFSNLFWLTLTRHYEPKKYVASLRLSNASNLRPDIAISRDVCLQYSQYEYRMNMIARTHEAECNGISNYKLDTVYTQVYIHVCRVIIYNDVFIIICLFIFVRVCAI